MFYNLTQDFDSLPKKKINFNCFEANKVNEPCKTYEKQVLTEESPKEIFSSAVKRPLEIKTGPNKRIKISTKPNYDFIDTQLQVTPFQKPRQSIAAGPLSSKFSNFLSQNSHCSVSGLVLDSKTQFGCKVLTVDFGHTKLPELQGPMTLIHFSPLTFTGQVTITSPILIKSSNTSYVLCKDIV